MVSYAILIVDPCQFVCGAK